MNLRLRLALTVLVAAGCIVPVMLHIQERVELDALERGLVEFAEQHMTRWGRAVCEADPQNFPPPQPGVRPPPRPGGRGRPGPGRRGPPRGDFDREFERQFRPARLEDQPAPPRDTRFWAYNPDFRSDNDRAPTMPDRIIAALERDANSARFLQGNFLWVGVAMAWETGPCRYILVRRELNPVDRTQSFLPALGGVAGVLLLAVFASAGPIVRRIRRLGTAVADPEARPVPVEGRDEIAGLARSFNEAFDAVSEREKTLRRFVANTTHDMMTPLTVLQGHLADGSPEAVRAALEEAHYMGALMHNLSAASKLEGGATGMTVDDVDVNELVHRVYARHRPLADLKRLAFHEAVPERPVVVRGDVTLLEQSVGNLVHNAIRYHREAGNIALSLRTEGDQFVLVVRDDGPGVSDEQLAHLTERRFRGNEARTRAPDGSGIGLHIVADVADRHEFQLRFAHADGGGLEATLRGARA